MRIAVFNDNRVGLVRGERVVDVSDLVGAGGDEWPPVFMLHLIANFDELRPRLEAALDDRTRSSPRPPTTANTSKRCARS